MFDLSVYMGDVLLDCSGASDNEAIKSYVWTFRYDYEDVRLEGKTHLYRFDIPGVYEINLDVTDEAGNIASTAFILTIRETEAPLPDPGPDRAEDQNTVVLLDGSASSDNVGIVRYEWTFVHDIEEVTLEGVTASYTFTRPSVIDVTLRVWDAADNSAASTFELTIRDTEAPIAGMDIGSTLIVKGETAGWNAIGSTDNVGIVKYTWTFDYDGRTVSLDGPAPTFLFEVAGEYEVTLTVEDAAGNTDTETFTLTVESHAWMWALLVIILVCVAWVLSVLMRMRAGTKAAGKRDRED